MKGSYCDNEDDLGPLTMPCWGQHRLAAQSRGPEPRYFSPCGEERQCPGKGRARFSEAVSSTRGSAANTPLPMDRAGAPLDQAP